MRTRSALSYDPPKSWNRQKNDDAISTKRQSEKMLTDHTRNLANDDENFQMDDKILKKHDDTSAEVHKNLKNDDRNAKETNDTPTTSDVFTVNGELYSNPIVVVERDADSGLDSLVESLRTPRRRRGQLIQIFDAASPSPLHVLRSGRAVCAQRSTLCRRKSKQTIRQKSATPAGNTKQQKKKENDKKEKTPKRRRQLKKRDEITIVEESKQLLLKSSESEAENHRQRKDYERSTFPRHTTTNKSENTTRIRSINVSHVTTSTTYYHQETVIVDQAINVDDELAGLLNESISVYKQKRRNSIIDLTQGNEQEIDVNQDQDQSGECIVLSHHEDKDGQQEELSQSHLFDDVTNHLEETANEEDLDTFPEDGISQLTEIKNRKNRSMTASTVDNNTTYHTATQSMISEPNCNDSTLLDEVPVKIENHEQEQLHLYDISETTQVEDVSDQFRQRYLSEEFGVLLKTEQINQAVQTTKIEKRSCGTQTSEEENGAMTNNVKATSCVAIQTGNVDLIRSRNYRCATCSIYLDTAEEYRLHVTKYSIHEGCRKRQETQTPASSYLRRSYRRSAPFNIDNASFFTTDDDDSKANYYKPVLIPKGSAIAKKSDESIDKSLMRSLLNEPDSAGKNSSAAGSDQSKNSRWSVRFYDDNYSSTVADENISTTTTSTNAFTNSTLSSISNPSIHDTIEEEQLCHYYDDTSARNKFLGLDSSCLTSVSQEFDSELYSFVLEPQTGLKRNGRLVRNIRKHLKYFPPPVHHSSPQNSPRRADHSIIDSFVFSNDTEGNVAIYQFSSSECQEMEENASHHLKRIFTHSLAENTVNTKAKQSVISRPNAGPSTDDNLSSFSAATTTRMSSAQREALNQLNGAISALDSLISDGRAFERRFESFERSARARMQSIESGKSSTGLAPTKTSVIDVDSEIIRPLCGGIYKLKALIVKFEKITACSDSVELAASPFTKPTTKPSAVEVEKTISLQKKQKTTIDFTVGPDADEEVHDDKGNRVAFNKQSEAEEANVKKPNDQAASSPKRSAEGDDCVSSPAMATPARQSRNVRIGRNRRSGMITPVRYHRDDETASSSTSAEKYATTPRTTREVLAHLKLRHPLDDFSDEDNDNEYQDNSDDLIDAVIRSRNAFTPLPGPVVVCRLCGVRLNGQTALNLHYVCQHMDELAKHVNNEETGARKTSDKNNDEEQDEKMKADERRVTSVDSGNASVSGRGATPPNSILVNLGEDDELFLFEEGGDTSQMMVQTPLPTFDELEAFAGELPRRRSPARRLFCSLSSANDDGQQLVDGLALVTNLPTAAVDGVDNAKLSSGIASAASGAPFPSNDTSKSAWIRWANLNDGEPILSVNRCKAQLFTQSVREGVPRISFNSFSSQNNSPAFSRHASANSTAFDDHGEPCEDTSASSSIQYNAYNGDDFGIFPKSTIAVDRTQSFVEGDESPATAPSSPTSSGPANDIPLKRMAPPRFYTPDNHPITPDQVLSIQSTASSAGKRSPASPLDAMFDISARIERFNCGTPLPKVGHDEEEEGEIHSSERKQRRRTGYDQKTTPSVREMVQLIHDSASTSKSADGRRKGDNGFGTPLTHTISLLTGRQMEPFNIWRAVESDRRFDTLDLFHSPTKTRNVKRRVAKPPPALDGLRFVASFKHALCEMKKRKAQREVAREAAAVPSY